VDTKLIVNSRAALINFFAPDAALIRVNTVNNFLELYYGYAVRSGFKYVFPVLSSFLFSF